MSKYEDARKRLSDLTLQKDNKKTKHELTVQKLADTYRKDSDKLTARVKQATAILGKEEHRIRTHLLCIVGGWVTKNRKGLLTEMYGSGAIPERDVENFLRFFEVVGQ